MNIKMITENPIERLRISDKLTQEDMAAKLGYAHKHQYAHHAQSYTADIIQKVQDVYAIDLTMEIIAYLKYQIRVLKPANQSKRSTPKINSDSSPLLDF